MRAVEREVVYQGDGTEKVKATIYANGLSTLPEDGSDVDGMLDTDEFAEGTIVLDETSGDVAMYGSDNQFHKW